MAFLCITEYNRLGADYSGIGIMAPNVPAFKEQALPINSGQNVSQPFGPTTSLVLIQCDVVCHLGWADPGQTPVAAAPYHKMGAYGERFYTVRPGCMVAVTLGMP